MWKNQIEFLDALVEIKKEIPAIRYLLLTPMADMPQMQAFKDVQRTLGVADSTPVAGYAAEGRHAVLLCGHRCRDNSTIAMKDSASGSWKRWPWEHRLLPLMKGEYVILLKDVLLVILIRNGAQEMADEIVRILKDAAVRQRMSEAGPRWVAERFSRERMIDEYHRYFKSILLQQTDVKK